MRASLIHLWPALSRRFGIHPWDVERLTFNELEAYVDDLEAEVREIQRQQKQRSRRR